MTASIAYHHGELQACEQDGAWTVRLANLETRARYLDLALAQLLGNAPEAHRAAARLLIELADVTERQAASLHVAEPPPRIRRSPPRHKLSAMPALLAFRVIVFAVVASTTFMLTTWLSTLR
ncbi:MAG TPA: hypothetical protein VJ838_14980 [Gaiellaceae bacterium]|nr:hypothetical protein [Gaiellaceae bacterium]